MATTINGDGEISGSGSTPTLTLTDSDGTNDIATFEGVAGAARITARDGNADGEVIFRKYDGTTYDETARITNTGRLGVGTNSPGALLDIYAGADSTTYFKGGTSHADRQMTFTSSTTGNPGDTHTIRAPSSTGELAFTTNATERLRIDKDGKVRTGGSSNSAPAHSFYYDNDGLGALCVQNPNTTAGASVVSFAKGLNSSATSNFLVKFFVNNFSTGSGGITANGTSQAAFGTYSDERLKENIVNLPSQLENIKKLRPVEFDYKTGGHQIGFVAQEFQTVYPDAVGSVQSEDDPEVELLTISGWSKTEARLVKALQEAIAKIETLETKVAALEGGS